MKILKIISVVLVVIAASLGLTVWIVSEPLPEGEQGPAAEDLADKMLMAINKPAYDSLTELRWTFRGEHHYIWDKQANVVNVRWNDFEVDLDPGSLTGTAKKNEVLLDGAAHQQAIDKAWAFFANDSFWLVAPYKLRDPGTSRSVVETTDGPALLVTYSSGGVTPGDSYLWILDESGRPTSWKMWVSILPVKGLEFTWEGWTQYGGAWFAPDHQGPGPASVPLSNLAIR